MGGLIRTVSNHMHRSFTSELKASGVTVAEWAVLRLMHVSGDTIASSEIADYTGMTRGAISKMIDRNTKKGLVLRSESIADRRYQDIKLTKKGKDLVTEFAKMTKTINHKFFSCLSATERKNLERLLQKIAKENQITGIAIQ